MHLSLLLLIAACQSGSASDSPGSPVGAEATTLKKARAIEVHDLNNGVTAKIAPGHPCRASVDGIELQVGGEPLVAQVGTTRWTGEDRGNGITLLKDNEIVARIVDDKPGELSLIDPQGIALIRALAQGDDVQVIDKQSAVVRHVTRSERGVEVQPGPTVSGTEDRLLVAALTAVEAPPEVRALAACHRLFSLEKK